MCIPTKLKKYQNGPLCYSSMLHMSLSASPIIYLGLKNTDERIRSTIQEYALRYTTQMYFSFLVAFQLSLIP